MTKILFAAAVCAVSLLEGAFAGEIEPFGASGDAFDPEGGHIQGLAASEEAVYVSQMTRIVKLDWRGNVLAKREAISHTGDIAWHDGELYAAVAVYPECKEGRIQVFDGELRLLRETSIDRTVDGIAAPDRLAGLAAGVGHPISRRRDYGIIRAWK